MPSTQPTVIASPDVVSGGTLVTLQGTNLRPNDLMVFYLRDPAKPTEPILQIGTKQTDASGQLHLVVHLSQRPALDVDLGRERDCAVDGHRRLFDGAAARGAVDHNPDDHRADARRGYVDPGSDERIPHAYQPAGDLSHLDADAQS